MKGLLITFAAIAAAHPFALDFSDDDRSYGHHGKPAEYKAMDGIVHPWREAGSGDRKNVVVSDPLAALHALWLEDMDRLDYELADTVGVMDPFNELHVDLKKPSRPADSDAEEDEAMLTIMESTPDMCPLCAKEGHALGHDAHKKILARLREKLVGKDKNKKDEEEKKMMMGCELCMAEGNTRNHKEHLALKESSCPLCRAEGTKEHHAKHAALLSLAQELSFEPKSKSKESSGCRLCRAEGSTRNHSKHAELLRMAERKSSMQGPEYRKGLRRMLEMLGEHKDLAIAAKAEAQWARDRRQRSAMEMNFDFSFDDDLDMMDMDMNMDIFASMPYDMMQMKRGEPLRDFHRRAGEPADEDNEDEDNEEESLLDKIIRNIRDLLGLDDEDSMYARMDDDNEDAEGSKDLAGIIAMLLLLFVGLLLVSFGLVELLSLLMGEEGSNNGKAYQPLSFDAEERMILEMEDGLAMSMRKEASKGAISI